MARKKNYGFIQTLLTTLLTPEVIITLAVAIPLLIFGLGSTIKFFQFMSQPVIGGSIPVWALFVVGLIILVIYRNKRRY